MEILRLVLGIGRRRRARLLLLHDAGFPRGLVSKRTTTPRYFLTSNPLLSIAMPLYIRLDPRLLVAIDNAPGAASERALEAVSYSAAAWSAESGEARIGV